MPYPSRVVTVSVLVLAAVLTASGPCRAQTTAATPSTLSLTRDSIDVRELVGEAATRSTSSVLMAPVVSGSLTVAVKDLALRDALDLAAAARGFVVVPCGALLVVVPPAQAGAPDLAPLDLPTTRIKKLRDRGMEVRALLMALAGEAKINLVVGGAITGRVFVQLEDVPLSDAFRALAWATGLRWAVLGSTLFVGTPDEVTAAEGCWAASRKAP